jgi:hypothetical protein
MDNMGWHILYSEDPSERMLQLAISVLYLLPPLPGRQPRAISGTGFNRRLVAEVQSRILHNLPYKILGASVTAKGYVGACHVTTEVCFLSILGILAVSVAYEDTNR